MKLRNLVFAFGVLVVVFSLVACTRSDDIGDSPQPPPSDTQMSEPPTSGTQNTAQSELHTITDGRWADFRYIVADSNIFRYGQFYGDGQGFVFSGGGGMLWFTWHTEGNQLIIESDSQTVVWDGVWEYSIVTLPDGTDEMTLRRIDDGSVGAILTRIDVTIVPIVETAFDELPSDPITFRDSNSNIVFGSSEILGATVTARTNGLHGISFSLAETGTIVFATNALVGATLHLYFGNNHVAEGQIVAPTTGTRYIFDGHLTEDMAEQIVYFIFSELGLTEMVAETLPTVLVANETELRATVASANVPTSIVLTADIELVSNFIIPGGTEITLSSEGDNEFRLIATRDMDTITLEPNAILTMENIGVTRTSGTTGRGVFVGGGSFTMNGGTISNNSAAWNADGAGVYVGAPITANLGMPNRPQFFGGVFTMNGGMISENAAGRDGAGGGVLVHNMESVFSMNGGTISNNTAGTGGGISNRGIMMLNDGLIIDNRSNRGGGGIYSNGSLTIEGGTISGNSADVGGGVQTWVPGTFVMNGGLISGNIATRDGGGAFLGGESISINNGYITDNRAERNGGGVLVRNSVHMSGGTISENIALNGGGVNLETGTRFTMQGGLINNNTASTNGGGVNHGGNLFSFDGGWIFDNNAANGEDVNIGQGTFNNNVFDPSIGAIGSSPPNQ